MANRLKFIEVDEFEELEYARGTFNGRIFYESHKEDEFWSDDRIKLILAAGKRLKNMIGASHEVVLDNWRVNGSDLVIKRGGGPVVIEKEDYTLARLQGMAAALCYERRAGMTGVIVAIAKAKGFQWSSEPNACKLYLSFTPGSKHFWHILGPWPLVATALLVKHDKNEDRAYNIDRQLMSEELPTDATIQAAINLIRVHGGLATRIKIQALIDHLFD